MSNKIDINVENYKDMTGLKKKLFQIFKAITAKLTSIETRLDSGDINSSGGSNFIDESPIGTISPFSGSTAPDGWQVCNGSAVSRSTYSDLFDLIGTTYGAGDGSTTFNLPDLRGEFIRGLDNGRGVDSGRSLGSNQSDIIGPHDHGFFATSTDNASGTWDYIVTNDSGSNSPNTGAIKSNGNNIGNETRPRNVALNYIIKTNSTITQVDNSGNFQIPDGSVTTPKLASTVGYIEDSGREVRQGGDSVHEWTKFSNGQMTIEGYEKRAPGSWVASGSVFRRDLTGISFPQNFVGDGPSVKVDCSGSAAFCSLRSTLLTEFSSTIWTYSSSVSTGDYFIHYSAKGRWK